MKQPTPKIFMKVNGKVIIMCQAPENEWFMNKLCNTIGDNFVILRKCTGTDKDYKILEALNMIKAYIP